MGEDGERNMVVLVVARRPGIKGIFKGLLQ
jgi:hypothetical protein